MTTETSDGSALEVVRGLITRFERADSNRVREVLESSDSVDQAHIGLGELAAAEGGLA